MVRFKGTPPYLTFVEYGRAAVHAQLPPDERERYEQTERALRARLSADDYQRLQFDMAAAEADIRRRMWEGKTDASTE